MKTELRKNGTRRVQTINNEPSKAQQQFKDQCDIKRIIQKRTQMGIPTQLIPDIAGGVIQDYSTIGDYRTNMQKLVNANESFMALPAKLRQKFNNDPADLINFLQNQQNDEEAIKLGLKIAPVPKEPQNDDKTTIKGSTPGTVAPQA